MQSVTTFLENQLNYNAPQFVYNILYNKTPPIMGGRDVSHKTNIINNIPIDEKIPKNAMLELFKIKEIELRSSCQGQDKNHPTFVIFRLNKPHNESHVKSIVEKLNKYPDIKSGYNLGKQNKYRIGVTSDLWYDKDPKTFEKWWISLPKKIKESL
ncbi:MAG: hypothetical protein ACOC33_01990 [bacterium]